MEMMEPNKELTEEQKKKLKALMYSHMKNGSLTGFKVATLLFLANSVVIAIDLLYVQSQAFIFIASAMNAIFILPILSRDGKKEHDRMKEEIKKIL